MRILHIVTSLQTGGAETLIVNLMPRFRDLGHKVGLVVFNGQHTALMERLEKECPECIIYKLGTSYYNPWYIVKLIGIMKKYDIVHTHNSSPQLFAAIANFFLQKKLITTEHNTSNRRRYWKCRSPDSSPLHLRTPSAGRPKRRSSGLSHPPPQAVRPSCRSGNRTWPTGRQE